MDYWPNIVRGVVLVILILGMLFQLYTPFQALAGAFMFVLIFEGYVKFIHKK